MNNDRGRACEGRIFPAPKPKTTGRVGAISTPNLSAGNVSRAVQSTRISGAFRCFAPYVTPLSVLSESGSARDRRMVRALGPGDPAAASVDRRGPAGLSVRRWCTYPHERAGRATSAHGATPMPAHVRVSVARCRPGCVGPLCGAGRLSAPGFVVSSVAPTPPGFDLVPLARFVFLGPPSPRPLPGGIPTVCSRGLSPRLPAPASIPCASLPGRAAPGDSSCSRAPRAGRTAPGRLPSSGLPWHPGSRAPMSPARRTVGPRPCCQPGWPLLVVDAPGAQPPASAACAACPSGPGRPSDGAPRASSP